MTEFLIRVQPTVLRACNSSTQFAACVSSAGYYHAFLARERLAMLSGFEALLPSQYLTHPIQDPQVALLLTRQICSGRLLYWPGQQNWTCTSILQWITGPSNS